MNNNMYALKDTDTKDICYFSEFNLETEAWIRRHYIELDSGIILYDVDKYGNLFVSDHQRTKDFEEYLESLYKNYINFGG